jgi:hypothetical protein
MNMTDTGILPRKDLQPSRCKICNGTAVKFDFTISNSEGLKGSSVQKIRKIGTHVDLGQFQLPSLPRSYSC